MNLFARLSSTDSPEGEGNGLWLTWSKEFRKTFYSIKRTAEFQELMPRLIFVEGFNEYNYSYHVDYDLIAGSRSLKRLESFSPSLFNFDVADRLFFFTGLIDDLVSSEDLHRLFACLRSIIVHRYKYEMHALYAPLTAGNRGEFPLHCDMYIPKLLFNVFDEVPDDNSGASVFLPTSCLTETILPDLRKMPVPVRERIVSIIDHDEPVDRYEELYDLLNGRFKAWYRTLRARAKNVAITRKFRKGEGYLLHDRRWLHGRTKPRGFMSEKRVHRLIFNAKVK